MICSALVGPSQPSTMTSLSDNSVTVTKNCSSSVRTFLARSLTSWNRRSSAGTRITRSLRSLLSVLSLAFWVNRTTDRLRRDDDAGPRRRIEEQHRIERVPIGCARAGNKAPVVRITNAEIERALAEDRRPVLASSALDSAGRACPSACGNSVEVEAGSRIPLPPQSLGARRRDPSVLRGCRPSA
jgi:hypothetical protein